MHSFHANSANFHFNGDFLGEIIINDKKGNEVRVKSEDLLNFVATEYIQSNLIANIGQMDYKELMELNLKLK